MILYYEDGKALNWQYFSIYAFFIYIMQIELLHLSSDELINRLWRILNGFYRLCSRLSLIFLLSLSSIFVSMFPGGGSGLIIKGLGLG